jgi:hypothetical protein
VKVNGTQRLIVGLISASTLAVPAIAQTARTAGVVRDIDGHPIRGATIRAVNPDINSRQIVSTTDSKGRWAMLGLRIGTYTFTVDAPGFLPAQGDAPVRTAIGAPLVFVLAKDPGSIPGALPTNIQFQIAAANRLRDQGQIDEAISAYQDIRNRNSSLTMMNLVMGATYRRKAALTADAAARRVALDRAIECYLQLLKAEPDNDRAKTELVSARAEAAAILN